MYNERALGDEDAAHQYELKLLRLFPDSTEAVQLTRQNFHQPMTTPGSTDNKPQPPAESRGPAAQSGPGTASESVHKPEPLRGPGHILRSARESAHLSLDSLAAQIKLARGTLEALERDDFRHLERAGLRARLLPQVRQGPQYRRGRADRGLREAGAGAPAGASFAAHLDLVLGGGNAGLERSRRSIGGWIPMLLVVIAAGIFVGWLLRNEPGRHAAAAPAGPAPLTEAPAETPAPPQAPTPAPEASAPAPAADSAAPAPAAGEAASAPAPAASSAASGAASSGQALVLDFKDTSWVRVQDADGKTLLSGVVQQGQRQVLGGKPPYSLYIGNARGVEVQYAGNPVSLAPFIKDNDTAKLTVPVGN